MVMLTTSLQIKEDRMKSLTLGLLERLPLAQVVLVCWSFVMDDTSLEELFERHRGAGYRRKLGFATLVGLIRDAFLSREAGAGGPAWARGRGGGGGGAGA